MELHGLELHGLELHGLELHGWELHGWEIHSLEIDSEMRLLGMTRARTPHNGLPRKTGCQA